MTTIAVAPLSFYSTKKPPPPAKEENSWAVHVTNLPVNYSRKSLIALFKNCNIRPFAAHITHVGKQDFCFGYAEFKNSEEQKKALTMDQFVVLGRPIRMKPWKPKPAQSRAQTKPRPPKKPKNSGARK